MKTKIMHEWRFDIAIKIFYEGLCRVALASVVGLFAGRSLLTTCTRVNFALDPNTQLARGLFISKVHQR